jgi:hypothetical protein
MPSEENPKKTIDLSPFGGRKILDSVAVQPEKPIDLSHLGGKRIGQHQRDVSSEESDADTDLVI